MGVFKGGQQQLTMGDASDPRQVSICAAASQAISSRNAAGPGLLAQCNALRNNNVAAGRLVTDAYAVDGALRVSLTNAGEALIASNPTLALALSRVPAAQQRGFKIGTAVRLGSKDAGYANFVKSGLDAATAQGFAIGMAPPVATQNAAAPPASGTSKTVLIVGGVVGVGALGALAYFLLR